MKIISRHIHRTFEREKDTRRTEEEEKGSSTYLVNIWIVPNTWNVGSSRGKRRIENNCVYITLLDSGMLYVDIPRSGRNETVKRDIYTFCRTSLVCDKFSTQHFLNLSHFSANSRNFFVSRNANTKIKELN